MRDGVVGCMGAAEVARRWLPNLGAGGSLKPHIGHLGGVSRSLVPWIGHSIWGLVTWATQQLGTWVSKPPFEDALPPSSCLLRSLMHET